MHNKTVKSILSERSRLLAELGTLSHMLHGSWVERLTQLNLAIMKLTSRES
jgi:hypothetical protein